MLDRVFHWRRRSAASAGSAAISPQWTARFALLALSCGLGLAYAFAVVGPRVMNPLDVSWLSGDPTTSYLGWAFFRREAHLTLPLGWSQAIGYPLGEPIAYLDSIPLLATAGWMTGGILPENFQYLGIYFAVCCILQFYFGFRISTRICGTGVVAGAFGGCLFLTAPAFTWRASGHFALVSHWLLLAGIDQLLVASAGLSRAQTAWRSALCFVAASINPYITAMTLLVVSGAYARTMISVPKQRLRSCAGLALGCCAALAGLVLFGFVGAGDVSQYAGVGYEKFSMNLLAPIDPEGYGSLLLREQPIRAGQYEGYNYLGLGLLLIGVAAIVRTPSSAGVLLRKEMIPALAIFVISLLLALSLLAKAGHFTLWHVTLPRSMMVPLASFRSSGRLFWPGYYLLFVAIIAAAVAAFPGRGLNVALAVAVAVQFLDLAPLRAAVYQQWRSSSPATVSSAAAWRDLGRMQRHLVVVPAWQCAGDASPGGYSGYEIFGLLALQQQMTINSFYAGRYSDRQIAFFCHDQVAQVEDTELQSDTAYVFGGDMAGDVAGMHYNGHYCRYVDEFILCSRVSGQSGLDPAILENFVTVHNGEIIPFGINATADRLARTGWWDAEPWGRWARGREAAVVFKVPRPGSGDVQIELTLRALVQASHPVQRVDVFANGQALPSLELTRPDITSVHLVVPARVIGDNGVVRIDLHFPDAVSPRSLGMSSDERELSIGVTQLRMENAGG